MNFEGYCGSGKGDGMDMAAGSGVAEEAEAEENSQEDMVGWIAFSLTIQARLVKKAVRDEKDSLLLVMRELVV